MKLYIDTKADKFDLWDFLHLNNDIFEINFTDIKIPIEKDGKVKDKKTIKLTKQQLKRINEFAEQVFGKPTNFKFPTKI